MNIKAKGKVLQENKSNGQFEFNKYFRVRHILKYSSLNYLQSGISFIASILLARYLGTTGYGQYAYGMVFGNTLLVLMKFGTDKTLVRDLIQLDFPEEVLTAASTLWTIIGLLGAISIFIWAFFISEMDHWAAWVVLLCTLGGITQGMTASAWLDFKGKMMLQAIYGVVGRLLFLIGILLVISAIQGNAAVVWAAGVLLMSRLISISLEWDFVRKTTRLVLKKAIPYIRKIFKNNVWVWWAAIGNLLMTQANQVILKDRGGTTELAYYGISFQIIMLVRLLQQQIMRLTAPSIADITNLETINPQKVIRSLKKYCIASFLSSLALLIPLFIITPWIIRHFIGKSYLPAIPVIKVLYLWVAFYGIALINNQFLIGLRKEKVFFRITLFFGIFSILLAFLFISKYKAMGAALSLLIAHFGSILSQFVIVFKTLKHLPDDK